MQYWRARKNQNCRGQGYDNGANMVGINNGDKTRILNRNPKISFHEFSTGTPPREPSSFSPRFLSSRRSLDIIGHWNAKRSSVPYLTYWALDVGWPAFEIVFPYWWTWKETVGGANW
ncbi:hypothetical protein TNCV_1548861 [Trichonephila clavipes]|nr:hypothetical protein TNCV_1548861 [Trichonephila clavipes]